MLDNININQVFCQHGALNGQNSLRLEESLWTYYLPCAKIVVVSVKRLVRMA